MDEARQTAESLDEVLAQLRELAPMHIRVSDLLLQLGAVHSQEQPPAAIQPTRLPSHGSTQHSPSTIVSREQTLWMVDWLDCHAGPNEEVLALQDRFERRMIDLRFSPLRNNFAMYADEASPYLYVKVPGSGTIRPVPWAKLESHRLGALFGMLLPRFKTRQNIPYKEVYSHVLDIPDWRHSYGTDSLRKLKSELNALFDGLLGGCVRSVGRRGLFSLQGQFSYCWIRPGDGRSRVSVYPPA